ncbi:MAG: hypothetical protein J0I06_25390 [Planctomycetes bacterium]|nr:hypothetical protein [Planctomycetota bacterium]
MRRFRAWGVAAALAVGASAPTAGAADEPAAATDSRPWYKRMFGGTPKPAGPIVRSGPVAAAPDRPPTSQPLSPDAVAAAFKAESDAYLRRMDVCLKLRQAALDRNDDALMRQVDELERQAKALYEQRVGALGVPKAAKAALPSSGTGFAASFDLAPEKQSDPKAAAARLVAPAAPVPVSGSAEVREVKP